MNRKTRVRFAPSPTGGLHLGGVRTALYNYLFAKQSGGDFILRIEDTDQTRFVEGAEEYILQTLRWCGLEPDESPAHGGKHAPYRQSERKKQYLAYAEKLVSDGYAYYAFDTEEDLENMRSKYTTAENPAPQYNALLREQMRNALTLPKEEVEKLLRNNTPHVIRIKMPLHEEIIFTDLIRGKIIFNGSLLDDKILLKTDGMPTYHLAVVVDDFLMEITHAFRGEEWLPSTPVHILLWKYLFGIEKMPQWAHLPLILKPDGNGKLSKRDGDRLGFPVFAMDWKDPRSKEIITGFKERGFLPETFVNMLAMLGWNNGSDQEIFSIDDLIAKFSIERIHHNGAKFDYEKAKWYNQEWIKKSSALRLLPDIQKILQENGINADAPALLSIIDLVKERCVLLTDFVTQAGYFFQRPAVVDIKNIYAKWDADKALFFTEWLLQIQSLEKWTTIDLETSFKNFALGKNSKHTELMLPLRLMLVGGKFGPSVFEIATLLGKEETMARIDRYTK